jgi:hypothetical protein
MRQAATAIAGEMEKSSQGPMICVAISTPDLITVDYGGDCLIKICWSFEGIEVEYEPHPNNMGVTHFPSARRDFEKAYLTVLRKIIPANYELPRSVSAA